MPSLAERCAQAFNKRHDYAVTKQVCSAANVCFTVTHIASAARAEIWLAGDADDFGHGRQEFKQAEARAAGDVDHFAAEGVGDGAGEEVGVDGVCDKGEVASLQTVAEHLRAHSFANALCKERDDCCVWGVMALARSENIEVAQADGFETVAVAPRAHQVFTGELGVRIGRQRVRAHGLHLGEDGRVAVRTARRGIDQATNAVSTRCFQDAHSARYVDLVIKRWDFNTAGHAAHSGLVEDDFSTGKRGIEDGVIADAAADHLRGGCGALQVGLTAVGEVVQDANRSTALH